MTASQWTSIFSNMIRRRRCTRKGVQVAHDDKRLTSCTSDTDGTALTAQGKEPSRMVVGTAPPPGRRAKMVMFV